MVARAGMAAFDEAADASTEDGAGDEAEEDALADALPDDVEPAQPTTYVQASAAKTSATSMASALCRIFFTTYTLTKPPFHQ